jgi:protein-histidine pros-kinase
VNLDTQTLFVAVAVAFVGGTLALAIVSWQTRAMAGVGHFALGHGLVALGATLLGLRGSIPDIISWAAANATLVLAACLHLGAMRLFFGLRAPAKSCAALVAGTFLATLYFLEIVPDTRARVLVAAAAQALVWGRAAWVTLRGSWREGNSPAFVIAISLACLSGVVGMRGVAAALAPSIPAGYWFLIPALLSGLLAGIGMTLGLTAAVNKRLTTAANQAGRLLAERESQYRGLVEASPDLIYRTDADGCFTYLNPAACRLLGLRREDVAGRRLADLVRADFAAELQASLTRQAQERIDTAYSEVPVIANGREVWLGQNVRLLPGQAGFEAIARDITERKRADQRFRELLEAAPYAMVIVDQPGRIVLVNSQAERLLGFSRDELVGQGIELLVPERARMAHVVHRASYLAEPRVREMGAGLELLIRCKDGREIPVEIRLSPLETADGILVSSAIQDVSARRRSEQMRDDLTHAMVHDLRNPLSSVGAALELLIESVPAHQQELPRMALKSARRLEALVAGILDIGRLESGQMPMSRQPVALERLLAGSLDEQRLLATGRRLALVSRVDADLPEVSADPALLGRVVQNLVGNSMKFTPEGGRIEVAARRCPDAPGEVEVCVTDDGPGVPPEMEGRLFQKFASGRQKHHGSGLGLAFCRLVVEAHGGHIEALAGRERGACFRFTLPAGSHHQQAAPPLVGAARAQAEAQPEPRSLRVLVVDDDPVNRKLAVIALTRLGHRGEEAADGEDALVALGRGVYDVVLMDMDMPRLGGVEAARRIRAQTALGQPRIIAVTASARREDRELCLAAGMDDFVTKPFRLQTIEAKLGRVAEAARTDETSAGSNVIDLQRWQELRQFEQDLAPGVLSELIDAFLSQAPPRLEDVRAALALGSPAEIRRTAHALKGMCGSIGASELARICADLESVGAPGDGPVRLQQMELALDLTCAWLTEARGAARG